MKNLFRIGLTLIMVFCAVATNAQHKIIKALDSNETEHHYFYNDKAQLVWELFGLNIRIYSYNDAGQNTSMTQYAWVYAENTYKATKEEVYTYDAEGNLTEKSVDNTLANPYGAKMSYKYYDYVNGVATYYDEYKNGNLYYMYKQLPEFDSSNRLVKCLVMYADPDKYPNPTHETVDYSSRDREITKSYDEDGNLISENDGKVTYNYTYTDLKAEYAPANFKSQVVGNRTELSWDAVPGAEKYILTYEQKVEEVMGTSKSVVVGDGERWFAVQAVIDGEVRNAAFTSSTMTDPGKLPVTDLAVGEMTRTEEAIESANADTRVFYNIPLTWTLPEGHSEIVKINVYYDSKTFGKDVVVPVAEKIQKGKDDEEIVILPNATSYTLKIDPYEVTEWDEDGKPVKGIETPVSVRIVYVSGESERSNIVYVNPFEKLENPTGIETITHNAADRIGKYLDNGKVVVLKNGRKYGVDAVEVK